MRGETSIMIAAAWCGAFVAVAEPLTITLLRRTATMDVPNHRSTHEVATPRGGGAPIAVGLVLVALAIGGSAAVAFAVAVAAFAIIGFADDLAGLPVSLRLLLQVVVSATVACALARRLSLPLVLLAAVAAVITVWLAAVVNAFNFMDGVNGISAAHAIVGGVAYASLGILRSDVFLTGVGAAIATGALAFLPWNAARARVFLGDVGSYGLGAALAVLAVCTVIRGLPVEAAMGPLSLYLADTAWTLQRRVRSGERWFEPHRMHVYQQWFDAGWSHQRVAAGTAAGTVLLCLLGMASLTGQFAIRVSADITAVGVLAAYLRSPALVRQIASRVSRA